MITWKIPTKKFSTTLKIASLKEDIKHWKDLEEKEQDPAMKLNYNTAKELCIAKKSLMEVRAGKRPESEEAQTMIEEETERNDLTRFEKFKKWARRISQVCQLSLSLLRESSRQLLWLGEMQRKKAQKLWEISEKRSPTFPKKLDQR